MRKIALVFIFLTILYIPTAVYASNGDYIVYIDPSGDRYHESTCRYGSQVVSLYDAVNKYNRTPCQICHPPELEDTETDNGNYNSNYNSNDVVAKTTPIPTTPTPEVIYVEKETEKESSDNWKLPVGVVTGAGALALIDKFRKKG